MTLLISLIVMLIIIGVALWAVRALLGAFGIGDPIATVVYVLVVLVCLIWVLQFFGIWSPAGLHVR